MVRLGDITTKIGSGATPRGGEECYLAERAQFALVRSQNVFDRRFEPSGLAFISDLQAEGLKGAAVRTGDVLLNITGDGITFARSCAVPDEVLPACVNQHVAIVRVNPEVAHPGFVLAFLTHPSVKSYIEAFNAGGSRRAVTKGHIESFRLPLPPLPEQHAIAHILGTLDDKIELNRRMSETLEAMARALFKSWFVDFDPVRAKAGGRQPSGMDADTSRFFPTEFEESEQAVVPKGWSRAPLGHWASALSGGTPDKGNPAFWGGDLPWISPKAMNSIHADEAEAFVTQQAAGKGTRIAPRGSTMIMVRGMGLHEKVRVSQARREVTFNQDVKAFVPRHIEANLLLFALLAAQDDLYSRVESSGHGTGKLASGVLSGHPIVMPPAEVQRHLAGVFRNINDRIASARTESRLLAALRDQLLPWLMSGGLSVATAERVQGAPA